MIDRNDIARKGFEQLSNSVSRHRFLERGAKIVLGTMGALAAGGLTTQIASAGSICCGGTDCNGNTVTGTTCPTGTGGPGGCPGGYILCTTGAGCSYCYWNSGYWTCKNNSGTVFYCSDCYYTATEYYPPCTTACTCTLQAA